MSTVAYEQALELVRKLSPEELQKLLRQIRTERQPAASATNDTACHHREREMRWLSEHRYEHIGSWVALDGDNLVCYDKDLGKVFAQASAQGVANPFTAFMDDPDVAQM